MVVTYSPKRAKKDMTDRERMVTKAERLLEEPGLIASTNKRGGRKYIDRTNKDKEKPTYNLAYDKIEKDAKFDGYYAIQTSEKTMSATDVMDAYHTLWKIEESFRIMKSTLEIRPVYHSSPERIKGHFVVCFLAFLMERKMELLLKGNTEDEGGKASPLRIQEALNSLQLVSISTSQGEKLIKVRPHMLASKIFNRIGIKMPNYINTKEELIDRFSLIADPTFLQMRLL
jgi:transposase